MYDKTTDIIFKKYGYVSKTVTVDNEKLITNDVAKSYNGISCLYHSDSETIIQADDETAILCILDSDSNTINYFSIHKVVHLYANIKFNIILRKNMDINVYSSNKSLSIETLNERIILAPILSTFTITEIYSYFYNIKGAGYKFDHSSNKYYEFIYVDNGSLVCKIANQDFVLNEYEAILICKDQEYSQEVTNKSTSFLSILFYLSIDDDSLLANKKFVINKDILFLIKTFINKTESNSLYKNDLMISYLKSIIGELLSIKMDKDIIKPVSPIHENIEKDLLNNVLTYIDENIFEPLDLNSICLHFSISKSTLQNIFKYNLNQSPKQYINKIKLNKSKMLIKESKYTIGEISSMLGFNSIHYFSRKFSKYYKMPPTTYAKKIYEKKSSD